MQLKLELFPLLEEQELPKEDDIQLHEVLFELSDGDTEDLLLHLSLEEQLVLLELSEMLNSNLFCVIFAHWTMTC